MTNLTPEDLHEIAVKWSNRKWVDSIARFIQDYGREVIVAHENAKLECAGPDHEDGPDEEGFRGPRPWNNYADEPVEYQARVGNGAWRNIDATKEHPTKKLRAEYLASIIANGESVYEIRELYTKK